MRTTLNKNLLTPVTVLTALLMNIGCASAPLTELSEAGQKTAVADTVTEEHKASLEQAGLLKCEEGANGHILSSNEVSCVNALRNQAAELGADLILISPSDERTKSPWGNKCNNCVAFAATAYKKKQGSVSAPSGSETNPAAGNGSTGPSPESDALKIQPKPAQPSTSDPTEANKEAM